MNELQTSGKHILAQTKQNGPEENGQPDAGEDHQQGCCPVPSAQGLYDPQFERDACGIGFVVNIKGQQSHDIIQKALTILVNLTHRGATGSEPNTGDGAGILFQTPHKFLQKVTAIENITLPALGQYGVGMVFLPLESDHRHACEQQFEAIVAAQGQTVLGWRTVPTSDATLGITARSNEPVVRQVFIGRSPAIQTDMEFERRLYVIRRLAEKQIRYGDNAHGRFFYIASLSYKTIVYKGMLLSEQVQPFYPDLQDKDMESALALVHSRFSTNTFPSWERAHPNRYIIHNGEINTIRGNQNWMRARESLLASPYFGAELAELLPVIDTDGSDSAMFDNALEFLLLNGRSLAHAIMMMIPEPWAKRTDMDPTLKAFYEYHSALMEPWDGPASIGFSDGFQIGAILDRNGLRPSRYTITKDGLVILASETGALEVAPENIAYKGRLEPGRMLLIDTVAGRIVSDEELKAQIARQYPYGEWLADNQVTLASLPDGGPLAPPDHNTVVQRQQAFGYTFEDLRLLLAPMAQSGVEALGSMGDDTPLAVLSDKAQPLFNYFKQLFAQVTNPPIDSIREELVTSTLTLLGSEGNLLQPTAVSCRMIKLNHPILTNQELGKLKALNLPGIQSATLPILYPVAQGGAGLEQALEDLFAAADTAVAQGAKVLILSDRGVNRQQAAIPALLAAAGLHHHLIRNGRRTETSIVVESGEPREVHHFAVLLGYGVDAINPYLAYETIGDMLRKRLVTGVSTDEAEYHYIKAVVKGVVKIMSKMGISTVQSYRGAQIFEALGLHKDVVERYFTGTPSRIQGADLNTLAKEVEIRHKMAFPERPSNGHALPVGGKYQWRQGGEPHLFNPKTIHALQTAVRSGDYEAFKLYSQGVNDQSRKLYTLRGMLDFNLASEPIPLEEVESVDAIVRRFKTGAMSYGSISKEAHEALAIAMNRLGGKSNTGEGGEDPDRFHRDENGDSRKSAIKQVASGRFGVTSHYLVNATEIQIKMAQGAKPGEGGQLPGRKVYPWIAKVRLSTPGVGLISPPPHHDIYSIEDLKQLIHDLKNANPRARINVKLVSEVGVGTIAAGVAKGYADVILISGHDGGTGASPQTSIKHAGLPWELGLAETHQTLLLNDLRSRVTLETDGQLKTGRDVVVAALLGAEEFGFATAPLVSLGCIMMRVCQKNTCPVGIATQNPELRGKFAGKPEHVEAFMRFVAQEVRELMAQLGFHSIEEMVGRSDKLRMREGIDNWKAQGLDLSPILHQPEVSPKVGRYCQVPQNHGLDQGMDRQLLLWLCKDSLEMGKKINATLPIRNVHRTVGTMLGSEVTRRYGAKGLPEDTIHLHFRGSAGQSFGAFIPRGITLELEGDANDYVGKGLSGGQIIVYPPTAATFDPAENVIAGNVALYGATSGEAYISGRAGERFAVRNSGATAVVEGVGDHGCEYMTGGRVVILGRTGRNFAAGMSGGIAYVLDREGDFYQRVNTEMVSLERLKEYEEIEALRLMILDHAKHTDSKRAWDTLAVWPDMVPQFVKVLPNDYKRMLEAIDQAKATGLEQEEAEIAAFEANMNDVARVSGN
ncbi:MAG: glutamate synthase large subunit [Chloroflexi bacterium]|nr:glutamate synthase large subunit [Chloroflexota bacterium]